VPAPSSSLHENQSILDGEEIGCEAPARADISHSKSENNTPPNLRINASDLMTQPE